MKKEYKKPLAEVIEFVPEEDIMNGDLGGLPGVGGEGGGVGGSGVGDDFDFDF